MMRYLEFDGARIAYRETGVGEPVMLLHCSGASHKAWRGLIDAHQAEFRFLAPDLYGNGDSGRWPGRSRMTLSNAAAPIRALIEAQDIPVHLVGHSYGGALALRLAIELPGRLRSLTLIEPSAFHVLRAGGSMSRAAQREIRALSDEVSRAVLAGDHWRGMARFVDYWSGPGTWTRMDEQSRALLAERLSAVPLDFHAIFSERTPAAAYRRLRVPSLVLRGGCSPVPARATAELVSTWIPGAWLEEIPAAGHMLPITHAGKVGAFVMAHLRRHRAAVMEVVSAAA